MVKIEVTEEDISEGRLTNMLLDRTCPIARALRRALPDEPNIRVGYSRIYFDWTRYYKLSPEVIAWIQAFDSGEDVKPFSLDLEYQ